MHQIVILGAGYISVEFVSIEIINLIALAIEFRIAYDKPRDRIYTHSTMLESLNELFQ